MRRPKWSFIPAFIAAVILSCASGCSGAGQVLREPDGAGGFMVYEMREGRRVDVAHVQKGGDVEYLDARRESGQIERGGGECSSGGGEISWWLCFTIVYFFVILIQLMIEACSEGHDCD